MEERRTVLHIVLAGGLLALGVGSIYEAFSLAGVTSMAGAHVLIVFAWVVFSLLIWLEIIPQARKRQKIFSIAMIGLLMVGIDYFMVKNSASNVAASPIPAPSGY